MFIEVKNRKADFSELNINHSHDVPLIELLHDYWQASDSEFMKYLDRLNIHVVDNRSNSTFEYMQKANDILNKIQRAFKKQDIESFDFRLTNVLKGNNINDFSENDFYKLSFDLSNYSDEKTKETIKNVFLQTKSRSLINFKNINDDICELYYYKKGLYKTNDEFKIIMARDRVTLLENFKEARDNNFISSGFILNFAKGLAKQGIREESFSQFYMAGNTQKEISKNIEEILSYEDLSQEEKEEKNSFEKLNLQANNKAKDEIKKEDQKFRQSLPKDNLEIQALKDSNSSMIISVRDMENMQEIKQENTTKNKKSNNQFSSENIDKIIENSFALYEQTQRQKLEIRMNKAKKDGENAYFDLKRNLEENYSIREALMYITQKYRNEDTINFASFLFTKDILNLKSKDLQIENLNDELLEKEEKIKEIFEAVEKRENTINSLRSTLTQKSNDFNALKENYEQEMADVEIKIKEKINELSKAYDEKIGTLNEDLQEADDIISNLEKTNNELLEKTKFYEDNLQDFKALQVENKFMKEKIEHLEKVEKQYDEIKPQIDEIKIIKNENDLLHEQKNTTENMLNMLSERVKNYETQVQNLMSLFQGNKINQVQENKIENIEEETQVSKILGKVK